MVCTDTHIYALDTGWHHIFDAQTQVSAQGSAILMKGFDYVPQSLQQNDGIVLRLDDCMLLCPFKIIQPLVTQFEPQKFQLNKL